MKLLPFNLLFLYVLSGFLLFFSCHSWAQENVDDLIQEGLFLVYIKENEKALAVFERVDELQPDDFKVTYFIGNILNNLKRYQESQKYLQRTEELGQQNGEKLPDDFYWQMAIALKNTGSLQEAQKYALEYDNLVQAPERQAQIKQFLQEISGQKKTTTKELIEEGVSLAQAKDYEAALSIFKEAEKQTENNTEIHYLIGKTLRLTNNYELALEHLRKSEELGGAPDDLFFELGIVLLKKESLLESRNYFDKYVQMAKSSEQSKLAQNFSQKISQRLAQEKIKLLLKEGLLLAENKNYEEALAKFQEVEKLIPNNTKIQYMIGRIFRLLENYDKAQVHLEKALQLGGMEDDVHFELGIVAVQKRSWEEAEQHFSTYIETGNNPEQVVLAEEYSEKIGLYTERKKAKEKPWRVSLTLAGFYDGNVLSVGDDVLLPEDISNEEDRGVFLSLYGEYFLLRDEKKSLRLSFNYSSNYHRELEEFNIQRLLPALKGDYLLSDDFLVGVEARFDYIFLGADPFQSIFSVSPYLKYEWNPWTSSTISYRYRYLNDFLEQDFRQLERGGNNHEVRISQLIEIPQLNLSFNLTYKYSENHASGSDFDFQEHDILLDAYYRLPYDILLIGSIEYIVAGYQEENFRAGLNQKREDNKMIYSVAINKKINYNLSAFVNYSYTDNRSNLNIFEFDRHHILFGFTVSY